MTSQRWLRRGTIGLAMLLAAGWTLVDGQEPNPPAGPVKVTIKDAKNTVLEVSRPVDPTPRIRFNANGMTCQINAEQGQTLHLGHSMMMKLDGQVYQMGGGPGGRYEKANSPLPKSSNGKPRPGSQSVYVQGDLRITFTAELVATRPAKGADKRAMDAVLLRYMVENKGTNSHKIGFKVHMDTYVISNDGCLFAAPTRPGKVLDGVELKGKDFPEYVQLLERPDLKNPGYVAHMTLALGGALEKPERIVLTSLGAAIDNWELQAVNANGDSALGLYWETKELKAGAKREFAYGYGRGIVPPVEGEGQFEVRLGGSFEPSKRFTVTAVVADPQPGQWLRLELPEGMEALEGKATQPVPVPLEEGGSSAVMWKCRVARMGEFPVRVHSSTGITQTKMVAIEKAN